MKDALDAEIDALCDRARGELANEVTALSMAHRVVTLLHQEGKISRTAFLEIAQALVEERRPLKAIETATEKRRR